MRKLLKLFLCVCLVFTSLPANAAIYYVRNNGGTGAQCTGLADAAYDGAGTGEACAFSHPAYAIGYYNFISSSSGGSAGVMVAGDTLIIDNVDYPSTGQAQYKIGYGSSAMPACNTNQYGYDCALRPVVGGSSSANKTKIYGKGYASCTTTPVNTKAQLYGVERTPQIFQLNSNIEIKCLDLTDHSNCIENGPLDGNVGGDPVRCQRDSAPFGAWSPNGIVSYGASNIVLQDVNIHGFAARGLFAYRSGDWTLENTHLVANGFVGWDSDGSGDDSYTGTTYVLNSSIDWSGCGEKYPLTTTDFNSSTDKHHCWSQDQGGFGDGIGLGDGNPGNWVFDYSSVSHNTSDGIDLLHGSGTGSIIIAHTRAEGNAGQQVKTNSALVEIENSVIIGNCGFFNGQSFTSTKGAAGTTVNFNNCRAAGTTIALAQSGPGKIAHIRNSTITSNGDVIISSMGSGCDGNSRIYTYNNTVLGGTDFHGGDIADFYYAAGATGNGDGSCGSLGITEDYNQIYYTKDGAADASGSHSRYGSPLLSGQSSLLMTTYPYYQGVNAVTLIELGASSPSRYSITGANSADETLTFSSYGTYDYYRNARPGSNWDGGAIQYGSVDNRGGTVTPPSCGVATGGACVINSDCCTNYCSSSVCSEFNLRINGVSAQSIYLH